MAWTPFFIAVTALVVVIVVLTRMSHRAIDVTPGGTATVRTGSRFASEDGEERTRSISTGELYANIVLSHGASAAVLVALLWWFEVPATAVGVVDPRPTIGMILGVGIGVGIALYALNEASVGILERLDIEYSEDLRRILAPNSAVGWLVLLLVVLPLIAGFEELLFRGVLIGTVGTATSVSPWIIAIGSSLVFAVGHSIQGPGGVIVTGVLGFLLAVAFILTGSLLTVLLAHYLINVFEFVRYATRRTESIDRVPS